MRYSKPARRKTISSKKTTAPSTTGACRSEHVEQRDFVSWWRKTQPDQIIGIPNAGRRGKAERGRLLLEGMTAGVWDLFLPARFTWIEFKRADGGRLSKEQRAFGEARIAEGYKCMVAWGCADAQAQLEHGIRASWKKPKKSS